MLVVLLCIVRDRFGLGSFVRPYFDDGYRSIIADRSIRLGTIPFECCVAEVTESEICEFQRRISPQSRRNVFELIKASLELLIRVLLELDRRFLVLN